MADLPQLSVRVQRKLALQWDALVGKHGFTGDHLNWPKTRRRKIVTGANRPPTNLSTGYFAPRGSDDSLPHGPAYESEDRVGISESGQLGVERFAQLTGEYFFASSAESVG